MNVSLSTDGEILMDFLKRRKDKLQNEEDSILIILDSMNKDNIDEIINRVLKLDKNKVSNGVAEISKLRPTQCEIFATFIHKILQLPDDSTEKDDSTCTWRDCFRSYMDCFPIPIIRLMYENGDFTLDEILSKINYFQSTAFADIIPDYYSFAKDFPEVRLSREWILSGCVPGSINALIKADDIDSVKRIIDESYSKSNQLPMPEFENDFYYFYTNIEKFERTPINVAAFYGAVKCFKYFLLIGHEITNHTANMAVAGGNLEIFRICEQQGVDLTGCERTAGDFCRFDLMKWFTEIKDKSAYSANSVSSILDVSSNQLDVDNFSNYVKPIDLLLKLVEEGKSLEGYKFIAMFRNVDKDIQIPIARAMMVRGFQPKHLFSLFGSDEFFKFAMEHYDLKEALKEEKYIVTNQIAVLGDELFNKLGEDGVWDYLDLYSFVYSEAANDRLYRIIEKNPSRVSSTEWGEIIQKRHTDCFKFIPQDMAMYIRIPTVPYSEIPETVSMYKSLPPNVTILIQGFSHPALFYQLSERINTYFMFGISFFNFFALKQLGKKCNDISLEHIKKCDTWEIVKQFCENDW